jgi:O-antigen ligase
MGIVALASGLSELPARLLATSPEGVGAIGVARHLFAHSVDRIPPLDPWYFALLVIEGVTLAWAAESIVRREPGITPRVLWCALMGHAAVGLLSVSRVVEASFRGGEFPASLPMLFLTVRNHTQYDLNAAASILVMVALSACGLLSRRPRTAVVGAISLVLAAVWITGSRMALAAVAVVVALVAAARSRRTRPDRRLLAAILVTTAVIAWLTVGYPAGRNLDVPSSIESRLVLFGAALAMTRDAPLLGVGAGTFLEESPEYGATALRPLLQRSRDNAHNYFLQTAAEQGVVGLLGLLVMLGAVLWPAIRRAREGDAVTLWLCAGVGASILTWLTGHPLLVPEAALVFWLFAGMLAGQSPAPTARRLGGPLLTVGAIVILASMPFRANAELRSVDLEHVAIGLSVWQPEVDGERYREAGADFSLFLPSGSMVTLPMRSALPGDARIELKYADRRIDGALAVPDVWGQFRLRVPQSDRRFVRIDFRVVGTDAGSGPCVACLWVGKAVPIGPG